MRPEECYFVLLRADQCDPAAHLCRPALGALANVDDDAPRDAPWAALAHGKTQSAFSLVKRADFSAEEAKAAIAAAEARLGARQPTWQVLQKAPAIGSLFGLLYPAQSIRPIDVGAPPDDPSRRGLDVSDDMSAEFLLSPALLSRAAAHLKSEELLVGAPKRGWLVIGRGGLNAWSPIAGLEQMVKGVHSRAGDQAICPYVLVVSGGVPRFMVQHDVTGENMAGTVSIREVKPLADPWRLQG